MGKQEQLAKDIARILNIKDLTDSEKDTLLRNKFPQWTQQNRKYQGRTIWSKEALAKYEKLLGTKKLLPMCKRFCEEHIVPIKVISDRLIEASNDRKVNEEWVKEYLERYLAICVVTKDEDRRLTKAGLRESMPDGTVVSDDNFNKWDRYNADNVKIEAKKIRWMTPDVNGETKLFSYKAEEEYIDMTKS